jgi:DNA-directed RNA polymerase sigma subunit (sigma70/sigma32)
MMKKKRPKLRDVILALGREQRDYVKSLRAKGMTYQAIGDDLGLTRERIRQILNRAKLDEA